MTLHFDRLFEGRPTWVVIIAALITLTIFGLLEFYSGYKLSLFIFFALPVVLVTWYSSRKLGYLFCLLATLTWLLAVRMSGNAYNHGWIFYWNGGIRLAFFLIVARGVSDVKILMRHQTRLAHVDGLTGCLNAYAFHEKCDTLLRLSYRLKQPISLGFIDLDNFKTINDTKGHSEGNRVLKAVAESMMKSVRSTDFVARMGGDEFAILLPNTDTEKAKVVFSHLRNQLDADVQCDWENSLGYSIGVVTIFNRLISTDEALKLADTLMYQVKKGGKNRVRFEVTET